MRVLVLSFKHHLLPIAWRLIREGHDVQTAVIKDRFEPCWLGKLPRQVIEPGAGSVEPIAELTRSAGLVVLTDSIFWTTKLRDAGAVNVWGMGPVEEMTEKPALQLAVGAWRNGLGETLMPHLWLQEMGAWTGGLGPYVPGAGMLVHLNAFPESLFEMVRAEVEALTFTGLVQVQVNIDREGNWSRRGIVAGWPQLHTQAFVSELFDFGNLLRGEVTDMARRYVTVLPLTVPPWPNVGTQPPLGHQVEGLEPKDLGQVFFHDATIDESGIKVAGADGLVGVVRGASNYPNESRRLALELAAKARVFEKQFRADGGALSERFLMALEHGTGVS